MSPQPQDMLPGSAVAAAVRRNGSPNGLFQQAPLQAGMTQGAAGYDPSMQTQPNAGSQAQNPMMPPQADPQAGMQQPTGGVQPMDESTMILQVLQDRLAHHSKVTEKTLSTIQKMVEAQLPAQDPNQNPPTA